MTKLIYFDVNEVSEADLWILAKMLPAEMREYASRYRNETDRKLSLVARLMLLNILQEEGTPYLIFDWKKDLNNKPFITNWKEFNLSHSGSIVTLCCCNRSVGVDIEKRVDLNWVEFTNYLHQIELHYISKSNHPKDAFYDIWVRKEAFLKATGLGLGNQIEIYNCAADIINYDHLDWYIKNIEVNERYSCSICSLENEMIEIKEFSFNFNCQS